MSEGNTDRGNDSTQGMVGPDPELSHYGLTGHVSHMPQEPERLHERPRVRHVPKGGTIVPQGMADQSLNGVTVDSLEDVTCDTGAGGSIKDTCATRVRRIRVVMWL